MEKQTDIEDELDKLDPEVWNNIPFPIIQSISTLKTSAKSQLSTLEYFKKNLYEFENKLNNKIISLQKNVSENSEKLKEIEEFVKKSIKTSEKAAIEKFSKIEAKIEEEKHKNSSYFEQNLKSIKDKQVLFQKNMDNILSSSQIQIMIDSATEKMRTKVKQETKEIMIDPGLYYLDQKISLYNR